MGRRLKPIALNKYRLSRRLQRLPSSQCYKMKQRGHSVVAAAAYTPATPNSAPQPPVFGGQQQLKLATAAIGIEDSAQRTNRLARHRAALPFMERARGCRRDMRGSMSAWEPRMAMRISTWSLRRFRFGSGPGNLGGARSNRAHAIYSSKRI